MAPSDSLTQFSVYNGPEARRLEKPAAVEQFVVELQRRLDTLGETLREQRRQV